MTFDQLIISIRRNAQQNYAADLSKEQTRAIIRYVFRHIADHALHERGVIRIPGFGTFRRKSHKGRRKVSVPGQDRQFAVPRVDTIKFTAANRIKIRSSK